MLQIPAILTTAPKGQRRSTCHELRSRLGQAALVVPPDERSPLQKRLDWMLATYGEDVVGALSYALSEQQKSAVREGRPVEGDAVEGRFFSWLGDRISKFGTPEAREYEQVWIWEEFANHVDDVYSDFVAGCLYDHDDEPIDDEGDALDYAWAQARRTYEEREEQDQEERDKDPDDLLDGEFCEEFNRVDGFWLEAGLTDDLVLRYFPGRTNDIWLIGQIDRLPPVMQRALDLVPVSSRRNDALLGRVRWISSLGPHWMCGSDLGDLSEEEEEDLGELTSRLVNLCRTAEHLYNEYRGWYTRLEMLRWATQSLLLDWFRGNPDVKIHQMSFYRIVAEAIRDHRRHLLERLRLEHGPALQQLDEAASNFVERASFKDGAKIVELTTVSALVYEGRAMGHCIGDFRHGHPQKLQRGETRVFSYRDPAGKPQATWEVGTKTQMNPDPRGNRWIEGQSLPTLDLQGPGNGPIQDPLARHRLAWFMVAMRRRFGQRVEGTTAASYLSPGPDAKVLDLGADVRDFGPGYVPGPDTDARVDLWITEAESDLVTFTP
jgi:hypothetical protein